MPDINEFTFWKASCVQNPKNCIYPTKVIVTDADSFNEMAHFDHVTAEYEKSVRHIRFVIWLLKIFYSPA